MQDALEWTVTGGGWAVSTIQTLREETETTPSPAIQANDQNGAKRLATGELRQMWPVGIGQNEALRGAERRGDKATKTWGMKTTLLLISPVSRGYVQM
jgi:hypothetical protein